MNATEFSPALCSKLQLAAKRAKLSRKHVFVVPSARGFCFSARYPKRDAYWTNGFYAGTYSADHRSGIRDSDVEQAAGLHN